MNGPQHYLEAERLLRQATDDVETPAARDAVNAHAGHWLAAAEVHARLAEVAARIDTSGPRTAHDEWRAAVS